MNSKSQFSELVNPRASALIETLRAIGYNLASAIADLLDNSISADARNIWIEYEWAGEGSRIIIRDDGVGMDENELVEAMRPGTHNPRDGRDSDDLGRFGLGLKTASFSQCRRLTVITKQTGKDIFFRTWDLDFVAEKGDWYLLRELPEDNIARKLLDMRHGTIVLWEKMDRITKGLLVNKEQDLDQFIYMLDTMEKHLSMVFHRFLEDGRLKIFLFNRPVTPWDPFLKSEKDTRLIGEEYLFGGEVKIRPYILPHKSRISSATFQYGAGTKGWNAHQGFYIYRNERLLVAGSWLGLVQKEEHYKLARISIDIPNSMDMEWQIDIKKSTARPPNTIKNQLKNIARITRSKAAKVYRHRGKRIDKYVYQDMVPVWLKKQRRQKIRYEINREHPLVKAIWENSEKKSQFSSLLRLLEETIPIESITINESESPHGHTRPFEGLQDKEVRKVAREIFIFLLSKGDSTEIARKKLLSIPPINDYPEIIETLIETS